MFSLETLLQITGDTEFADRLERIAMNALPAQISDDFMTCQYFQTANQVLISRARRNFYEEMYHAGTDLCFGLLTELPDGTPVVGAIVSPGYTPGALTVGSLNTRGTGARSDDGIATYSSRGPVGDPEDPSSWELKPDLVAPGNSIESAGAVGSALWSGYPERRVSGANGGTYLRLSGSSMAAAAVSGAVAQVLQAEPRLTPAQV